MVMAIGQVKFHNIGLFIMNQPVIRVKGNRTGQIYIIDILNNTYLAIEKPQGHNYYAGGLLYLQF